MCFSIFFLVGGQKKDHAIQVSIKMEFFSCIQLYPTCTCSYLYLYIFFICKYLLSYQQYCLAASSKRLIFILKKRAEKEPNGPLNHKGLKTDKALDTSTNPLAQIDLLFCILQFLLHLLSKWRGNSTLCPLYTIHLFMPLYLVLP